MRVRLVLIAIALAALAFAGLRYDDQRAIAPHHASGASSGLAAQPAPDAEPPAVVRAAVTASATAQTQLACECWRHVPAAPHVSTAGRHAPAASNDTAARPRSFPLLI